MPNWICMRCEDALPGDPPHKCEVGPMSDPRPRVAARKTSDRINQPTDRTTMNVSQISMTEADGATRFGLHSVEGFGKTTLVNFFPAPVTIAKRHSFPRDLPFRPKSFPEMERWEDVFAAIDSLRTDKHDRETVILDTADELESLCHQYVCKRDSGRKTELNKGGNELISIEDYGYGKGYVAAQEEFRRLLEALDRLQRDRRMHVCVLMHSAIRKFENPNGLNYDRWEPKMHLKSARLITEWVENLFFGYYETEAGKLSDERKAKGVSTGRRMLGTRYNAMYDAKNRMNLPETIELKQPEDMIPYLLGEHLVGAETPTSQTKKTSAPPPPPPAGEQSQAAAPKSSAKKGSATSTAKKGSASAPETVAAKEDPREKEPDWMTGKVDQKLLADMTQAMTLAKELGDKYAAKIEKWGKAAGGDPAKLQQLIELVYADHAEHQNTNTQTA